MTIIYTMRIVLLLLVIIILLIRLYYILKTQTNTKKSAISPSIKNEKNVISSLSNEKSKEIIELIETTFEQKKIYLNQGYTLDDLSKELAINKGYLSKAMNTYQVDFTTLLNYLRIKEAKELLCSELGNSYTIEAVSSLVGYKSKSSFNYHFKKNTGLTPKQYRKEFIN